MSKVSLTETIVTLTELYDQLIRYMLYRCPCCGQTSDPDHEVIDHAGWCGLEAARVLLIRFDEEAE